SLAPLPGQAHVTRKANANRRRRLADIGTSSRRITLADRLPGPLRILETAKSKDAARIPSGRDSPVALAMPCESFESIARSRAHGRGVHLFPASILLDRHVSLPRCRTHAARPRRLDGRAAEQFPS